MTSRSQDERGWPAPPDGVTVGRFRVQVAVAALGVLAGVLTWLTRDDGLDVLLTALLLVTAAANAGTAVTSWRVLRRRVDPLDAELERLTRHG